MKKQVLSSEIPTSIEQKLKIKVNERDFYYLTNGIRVM